MPSSEGYSLKPALPPKPATPVKGTPPPPPRQSAFHTQYASQSDTKTDSRMYYTDYGRAGDTLTDFPFSGTDKEQTEKRLYPKGGIEITTELLDSARGVINVNSRLAFYKVWVTFVYVTVGPTNVCFG